MSSRGTAYNPSCGAPGCNARASHLGKRDYCGIHSWMGGRDIQAMLDAIEVADAKHATKMAVFEYKLDGARKSWNWPRAFAMAAFWLSMVGK